MPFRTEIGEGRLEEARGARAVATLVGLDVIKGRQEGGRPERSGKNPGAIEQLKLLVPPDSDKPAFAMVHCCLG